MIFAGSWLLVHAKPWVIARTSKLFFMQFEILSLVTSVNFTPCVQYLFIFKPSNFCNKLNWELVKSLLDLGFAYSLNIYAKKFLLLLEQPQLNVYIYLSVSQVIINKHNYYAYTNHYWWY